MKKTIKATCFIILILSTLICSAFAYFLCVTKDVILDEDKLKSKDNLPKFYYSNGNEIKNNGYFTYVTLEEIPSHVKNAVIAIEDKRFYSHKGVDGRSIFRAIKTNVFSNSAKQGASTITQQLVKNTYLSGEKTLNRKFKEIKLAVLLEQKLSKDQILEKYLNTVYFGENSYGIYSASKRFFAKEPKELTVAEGATLVACLKAPKYYSPFKDFEKSTKRKNLILNEMQKQGYLDNSQLENCKNQDITLNYTTNYDKNNNLYNDVLDEISTKLTFENPYEISDGKIKTSLDEDLCKNIEKACDYDLSVDYSVLTIDNKTSSIVGYYSTVRNQKRIPASTVKPFLIYAPAIEEDLICPATKILDEKTSFDGYSPSNYSDKYYGYVSVKEALKKSLNVPSVKVYNMLGSEKVKHYAKKMDVEYKNNDLSVALGNLTGGLTLKQLCDAYSVFLNDGKYQKSSFVSEIKYENSKNSYKAKVTSSQVFSDSTAFLINDILRECAKTGTASKLNTLPFQVCAKTGTNGNENGNIDAYCFAYTPNHIVAVWIGKADGSYMSNKITGGNYPTAIAKEVLTYLYPNGNPNNFTMPNSVKEVEINKNLYDKDCKIYQNENGEKDGVKFYFKSDYKIEKAPKTQIKPIVKDYKITCNNCDISFLITVDENVFYKIFDLDENELFNSKNSLENFKFSTPCDGVYIFYLQPYTIENGKENLGEKIKLPSVLVEGKKQILDTKWWDD